MPSSLDTLSAAIAHHRAGRMEAAEALYRQILAEDAEQPNALYLLGVLTLATDRIEAAEALLQAGVRLRPAHAEGRLALANARFRQGKRDVAIREYRAVLALEPGHDGARVNLGRALHEAGDGAGALALLAPPILAQSGSSRAWSLRALILLAGGELPGSLDAAGQALARDHGNAEAWFVAGTAQGRLGRRAAAIDALHRALAADPGHAEASLNLGNVLLDLDRLDEAERHIRAAIAARPDLREAHASLGFLLSSTGRLAEAVAACEAAIACDPGFAQAHWNQAVACLLAGDFAPGWEKYEWRKRHEFFGPAFRRMDGTPWEGQNLIGKTLLVLAEQGFGDTIQFSRYLKLLQARGAQVVLACAPVLQPLLRCLVGVALVDRDGAFPPYDFWVDQMSLPRLFGTRVDSVPLAQGYLQADPAQVALCASALPARPRVGLAWAGNPAHSNDRRRSTDFAALAPLLAVPGLSFVSLQVGPAAGDAAGSVVHIVEGMAQDYGRTAAVVANLDLVITVDTSVCHLAGALGIPAWVMLPFAPEWRWMTERSDTPWYDSLRLFRQARPGDWPDLVSRVAAALRARFPG